MEESSISQEFSFIECDPIFCDDGSNETVNIITVNYVLIIGGSIFVLFIFLFFILRFRNLYSKRNKFLN